MIFTLALCLFQGGQQWGNPKKKQERWQWVPIGEKPPQPAGSCLHARWDIWKLRNRRLRNTETLSDIDLVAHSCFIWNCIGSRVNTLWLGWVLSFSILWALYRRLASPHRYHCCSVDMHRWCPGHFQFPGLPRLLVLGRRQTTRVCGVSSQNDSCYAYPSQSLVREQNKQSTILALVVCFRSSCKKMYLHLTHFSTWEELDSPH